MASTEARKLFGQIAAGHDPLEERRAATAHAANTLRTVVENYFATECGMVRDENGEAAFPQGDKAKLRSVGERLQALKRLVLPTLGSMPIADVRRSHIIKLTDRIAGENGPVMSDRTLTYLRQVLNWHAIRTDEYASPIVKGMMRATGRQRERILGDDELRRVASRGPRRRIRGAGEIHLADDSAARRSSETVLGQRSQDACGRFWRRQTRPRPIYSGSCLSPRTICLAACRGTRTATSWSPTTVERR